LQHQTWRRRLDVPVCRIGSRDRLIPILFRPIRPVALGSHVGKRLTALLLSGLAKQWSRALGGRG